MNNKRIAVLLATIMAVSMVAMGFVGTAAADPAEEDGDVYASPAGVEGSLNDVSASDHVITVEIADAADEEIAESGDSGVNAPDDADIEIEYTEANGDFDLSGFSDAADVDVEVVDDEGSVTTVTISDNNQVDGNSDGQLGIDIDDGENINLAEDDTLRVVLNGDVDHVDVENTNDVGVSVDTDGDGIDTTLNLDLPGDIELLDSDDNVDETFDSFEQAVEAAGADETVVVPEGTIDEFDRQPVAADDGLESATMSENGITIVGAGAGDSVVVSGASSGAIVDENSDRDELTVEEITLEGDGLLADATKAIEWGDTATSNVTNTELLDTDTAAIDVGTVADLDVDGNTIDAESTGIDVTEVDDGDADITDNTIQNLGDNTGVVVGDVGGTAAPNFVNITDNNEITGLEDSSAVGIDVDASDDDAVVNIEDVTEIGVDGGDATAIVTDADDAGAEININNTDVDGYAEADDVGIELNGGDKDTAADDLEVFIGEGTEIEGANTSVDVEFDGTSDEDEVLTIDDATFTLAGDGDSVTALDASENIGGATTVISIEGEGVVINGDADTTGIHADDGSIELSVDEAHEEASEINDVDTGIFVDTVDDITGDQITNTTFSDVDSVAIDISDAGGNDIAVEDITVDGEDSDAATAVSFSDGSHDITVLDSDLGVSADEEIQNGVEVTDRAGEIVVNDTDIYVDDGNAIEVSSSDSNPLTIDGTSVWGGDQTGTGIYIDDGSLNELNVNPDTEGSINDVETGVHIDAAGAALTLESGLEINDYAGTGVEIDDDAEHKLSGVHLTEADDAGATGVDITSTVGSTITIDYESTIQVADDADSEGVNVNSDDHIIIQSTTIEAKDGSSDGTAIQLDEIASVGGGDDTSIQFNDIEGFTGDGYGLAGDVTDLMAQNATGNWWGDDFGPQHEDASNVDIDVDAGASDAAIYDPFLTEEIEETDLDLSSPDASDVTSFAHDIYVEEGEIETVGFPSYSANELSEGEAYELTDDGEADIVRYDAVDQEWFGAAEADETPEGLDAYTVFGDDTDVLLKIEYEDEIAVPRGSYTYEEGFNLVPTAASNDDIGSAEVTASNTFDLAGEDDGEFTTGFESPGLQMTPSDQLTTATDGSDIGVIDDVSAFHPMWVFVNEDTTIDREVSAAFDPDADMQTVLDDIEQ